MGLFHIARSLSPPRSLVCGARPCFLCSPVISRPHASGQGCPAHFGSELSSLRRRLWGNKNSSSRRGFTREGGRTVCRRVGGSHLVQHRPAEMLVSRRTRRAGCFAIVILLLLSVNVPPSLKRPDDKSLRTRAKTWSRGVLSGARAGRTLSPRGSQASSLRPRSLSSPD